MPEIVGETTSFTTHEFKATMGRFASGVTVVTTRLGALRAGLTVNAFCSLSLEPPLVLICVDRSSRVHDVMVQAGIFAANLLSVEQEAVSRCFAGQSKTRWEEFCGCATHAVVTGAPVFDESLGFVDCSIVDVFPGGDHSIIVGRVEALGANASEPLLYFRGRYGLLRSASRSPGSRSPATHTAGRTARTDPARNGRSANPTPRDSARPRKKATRATPERAATRSARRRGTIGDATQDTTPDTLQAATPSVAGSAPERSEA
jgi:flavin reductase (DIM6/NTAB) family NADH-FMN oxidoreductase RutF